MAPVSVPEPAMDVAPSEESASKPTATIGIIYPPPEVRNIVDKTASFVARNGPEFEVRIRANEQNNPKFNFLNPGDPYNAYYQHKVTTFREMIAEGKVPQIEGQTPSAPALTPKIKQPVITEIPVPKEPPPAAEFIADPPSISALDLDVVKLTAQFVARNGRNFLTNLMNREQRNYQFDFLRPQHSLFNYFTKLVEQYTKVLIPPSDIRDKLQKDLDTQQNILKRVRYKVEWEKFQARERQKEEDAKEKERVAFAQVDWHDFVVVETVYFRENETGNLPPPVTREQLGARILAQERYEQLKETDETTDNDDVEMNMDVEMEVEDETLPQSDRREDKMDTEDMPRPPSPSKLLPPIPPLPPVGGQNIQIRRDYDPKAPKSQPIQVEAPDKYLISPITGERVPAERMAEHMKINLLDPRWREQADKYRMDKQNQEEVLAHGKSIGSSLKQFALRRTDIFGAGDEETVIGKKIGEEDARLPEKVTWDGHTASMATATRLAQEGITLEQQIEAIHKSKGLAHSEEVEKIGPAIPKNAPPHHPPPPGPDMHLPPSMPPMPPMPPRLPHGPPTSAPPVLPPPPPGPPRGMPPMPPQPPPVRMMQPPQPEYRAVPPPPPNQPPPPPPQRYITPAPPVQPPLEMMDEPAMKRAKIELTEAHLMPEDLFLQHHSSPVRFTVQVPNMPDKNEWNLNGQAITIVLPLTDQISVIKAKIHDATGMPAGKQKLQLGTIFVKDSNSLAFYNFTSDSVIQLQLKERGGRKK